MKKTSFVGQEIRSIRKNANESIEETAQHLGIDRTHLNKIELGAYKPSEKILNKIIDHFSVEGIKANQLRDFLKHGRVDHVVIEGVKKKGDVMQAKTPNQDVQVSVDPSKVQVLYSDSIFVSSSDYGLIMDVGQTAPGNPKQQFVVARIGMSFDHAKKLLEVINDHLQKNER